MIRRPLRPLAQILRVRAEGGNPDEIEARNRKERNRDMQNKLRRRSEGRILVVGVVFFMAFCAVGLRMGALAASEPAEPKAVSNGNPIIAQRADIVDRNGRILATNFDTHSLYAQPKMMVEPEHAARELVKIFPELEYERLIKDFTGDRTFLWLRRQISAEQMQQVHDIGEPGLLFGPREMRLYPNGPIAAHVLGGARYGREGVSSAEVIGVAGIEGYFNDVLRNPSLDGAPLQLALDLSVQATVEQVLEGGMMLLNAKGAAAIIMDVHTGEIISLASLPDFDPNNRPSVPATGDQSDSPLFNRAVQGVYELGSTFKIFTAAQAMELGLANPNTQINTQGPLTWGRFKIRDFHHYGASNSLTDVIVKSSNVGTGRVALQIGAARQRAFLDSLGLLDKSPLEITEASGSTPLVPQNWSDISTITISYGHGLSVSPMHLAAGYAAIANGGHFVQPTLLRQSNVPAGRQVMRPEVASAATSMLRQVVTRGTASFGQVPGYEVAGKTGTADKPRPRGGYYEDKVIATFASFFPASDPKYVLIVTLDEPEETSGPKPRRTAGWTAVPVAAEIVRRAGPLLGVRPQIESGSGLGVTQASQ